jgi:hypothetical protein
MPFLPRPKCFRESGRFQGIGEDGVRRHEIDPTVGTSTGCDYNSRTVKQLKDRRKIASSLRDVYRWVACASPVR